MDPKIYNSERYIILLCGVVDRPIPSLFHLHKELFVLAQNRIKIQEILNFQKHYFGPYSQLLDESVESPFYFPSTYEFKQGKIFITDKGRKEFKEIVDKFSDNQDFKQLLIELKLLREIYDRLTNDELLFLIYETYPEYTKLSQVYNDLVKNTTRRKHILIGLLQKKLITDKRYKELIEK